MSAADKPDNLVPFQGVETFARRSKFRLEDFNTLTPGRVMWRVKGLWPSVGLCFLGGPSMTGKTFWALDALARVCRGDQVLGRKSLAAGVVYVGAEDPNGIRLRIEGLRAELGPLPKDRFRFIGQAPDLTDAEDVDDLKSAILEARDAMQAQGVALGVICIDTMSAAIPGADENTAKDMSPVLSRLQALAVELGAMVLMVAHTGKDADRGLRGWSGLLANADGLIMLEDPEGNPTRVGKVVKVKNGPAGDQFAFGLRVVTTDVDEDGDDITTCVVDDESVPISSRPTRGRRLSPKLALILRAANLCLDDGMGESVPPPEGVPHGTKGIHRDKVKARAIAEGYDDGSAKPESVRRKLNSNLTDLIGFERLRASGDYLWVVQ